MKPGRVIKHKQRLLVAYRKLETELKSYYKKVGAK